MINLQDFCCQPHKEKAFMFCLQQNIAFNERFLCIKCFDFKPQALKFLSLSTISCYINDINNKIKENLAEDRHILIQRITDIQSNVSEFLSQVTKIIPQIMEITNNWKSWIQAYQGLDVGSERFFTLLLENQNLQETASELFQDQHNHTNNLMKGFRNKIVNALYQFDCSTQWDQVNKQLLDFNDLQYETFQRFRYRKWHPCEMFFQIQNITIKLKNQFEMEQWGVCKAISFNSDAKMLLAQNQNNFNYYLMEGKINQPTFNTYKSKFEGIVSCLTTSKKRDIFCFGTSKGNVGSILLLEDEFKEQKSEQMHQKQINQIILSRDEDQIFTCSNDCSIICWKLNQNSLEIKFNMSLSRHQKPVTSISINEQENLLVSCGKDKQIILWAKNNVGKWQLEKNIANVTNDFGYRICFVSHNLIAWQQCSKGITHFFDPETGLEIEKLRIQLNYDNEDEEPFQMVYLKDQQAIVQKHNKYLYFLKLNHLGYFQVASSPLDGGMINFSGCLSLDGKKLGIWNNLRYHLEVYDIDYQA